MAYILITQDGIARVSGSTPARIEGIYTEGLESCIAIAIKGNNGRISFIHDTGRIDKKTIKREMKWVGSSPSIEIYYNPTIQKTEASLQVTGIRAHLAELSFQDLPLLPAPLGAIFIERNGAVHTEKLARENIELPKHMIKRHLVNLLNNISQDGDKRVLGDLQFDGDTNISCPPLVDNLDFLNDLTINKFNETIAPHLNSLNPDITKVMQDFLTLNTQQFTLERHYFPAFYPAVLFNIGNAATAISAIGTLPKPKSGNSQNSEEIATHANTVSTSNNKK